MDIEDLINYCSSFLNVDEAITELAQMKAAINEARDVIDFYGGFPHIDELGEQNGWDFKEEVFVGEKARAWIADHHILISKEYTLANWLSKMPEYLIPVFEREFMRVQKKHNTDGEATEQGGRA